MVSWGSEPLIRHRYFQMQNTLQIGSYKYSNNDPAVITAMGQHKIPFRSCKKLMYYVSPAILWLVITTPQIGHFRPCNMNIELQ